MDEKIGLGHQQLARVAMVGLILGLDDKFDRPMWLVVGSLVRLFGIVYFYDLKDVAS